MTSHPQTPASRTLRHGLLMAALGALLAVATPVSALPVALPSVDQQIETPAGKIAASAGDQGAAVCSDLYTPALPVPALPAVPSLPVPVAVPALPALPSLYAGADSCVSAGLDGASITAGVDAAGAQAQTGITADSPVSQQEIEDTVGQATSGAKGFFESLVKTLFGWM